MKLRQAEPDLSIVIVSWNTRTLLAQCLESVYANPPGCDFEVWVVDNASGDGSAPMVRLRFPQAHLIENSWNAGFARANNQGIRSSSGNYVLLLNSDTIVPNGTLDEMIRFMRGRQGVGAVAPKLCHPDGSFQASCASFPTLFSEIGLMTGAARWLIGPYAPSPSPRRNETARSVDWVAGAALMARRSAIEQIGLLDEGYFYYSEEVDLCWRLKITGWDVWYLPHIYVTHYGGASTALRGSASYQQLYINKVRFFAKAYGPAESRRFETALRLIAFCRLLVWLILSLLLLPFEKRKSIRERVHQDCALITTGSNPKPL